MQSIRTLKSLAHMHQIVVYLFVSVALPSLLCACFSQSCSFAHIYFVTKRYGLAKEHTAANTPDVLTVHAGWLSMSCVSAV